MPHFNFSNLKLSYQTAGSGETALLFIHGLGGTGNVWKYQVEHFQADYLCLTVDLLGHGDSSKDVDPVLAPWLSAEAIVALMQTEIKRPYIAIGHSYAMDILPEIIRLEQTLLEGVVFVDCVYHSTEREIIERVNFAELMLGYEDAILKDRTALWYLEMIGERATAEDTNLIMSSLKQCDPRWLFLSAAGCRQREETKPHHQTPIPDKLPVLIVEAEYSFGTDLDRSWVNRFKKAEYSFFENRYHFLFVIDRGRFNKRIGWFLDDIKAE